MTACAVFTAINFAADIIKQNYIGGYNNGKMSETGIKEHRDVQLGILLHADWGCRRK